MNGPFLSTRFTIDAVTLACHQAYARDGQNVLRQNGAVSYDADHLAAVPEPLLFYGPYIAIEAGVYLLTFRGQLDGELSLDFAHDLGRSFKELSVDDFSAPVCLVITKPLANFEIRGRKTPLLRSMRLEAIDMECVYAER